MTRGKQRIRAVITRSWAVLLMTMVIIGTAVTAWGSSGAVWTTQQDFEAATRTNIDTTTTPDAFQIGTSKDVVTTATITCLTPNKVYTTGIDRASIAVFDSATRALSASIPLSKPAAGVVYNSVNNKLYVGQSNDNKVLVIDVATDTVITTLTAPTVGNGAYAAAYNPKDNKVYISNTADNTVSIIDGATDTRIASPVAVVAGGSTATYDAAADKVYFTSKANQFVTIIDGVTNRFEQNLQVADVLNLLGGTKGLRVDARQLGINSADKLKLSWDYDCADKQKMQFQIKMADDLSSLDGAAYKGPGGSAENWWEVECHDTAVNQSVTMDLDVQYKPAADLQVKLSSDGLSTPVIHEVRLNYGFTIEATAGNGGSITPAGTIDAPYGGRQDFSITPAPCYHTVDVVVDGVSQGPIQTYTFDNITASHTISATFAINTYVITPTSATGGAISPPDPVIAYCGDSRTFTINADPCDHITDVIVDGVSKGAITSYTFDNVTANHTISASFATNLYTVTVNAGSGGSVSPANTFTVPCSGSQTVIITPDPCYHVASVVVDGTSVGAVTSYVFSNVTANHTISVTFAPDLFVINATASSEGTIAPSGATNVACHASQTFTMTPNNGSLLESLLVDGVAVTPLPANNSYTFSNVMANHTISATFTFNITASADANGTISPAGVTAVSRGGSQTYTITPATGYRVGNVTVDGVYVGAVTSYTFDNVTASHTISASFMQVVNFVGTMEYRSNSEYLYSDGDNGLYRLYFLDYDTNGTWIDLNGISMRTDGNLDCSYTDYTFNLINDTSFTATCAGASETFTIGGATVTSSGSTVLHVGGTLRGESNKLVFYDANSVKLGEFVFTPQATAVVTATSSANGYIDPYGTNILTAGRSQTFTTGANAGYHLADLVVDGKSVGTPGSYTFTNLDRPHTIRASYLP